MNEYEKAKECFEFLKNFCKADGSNCGKNCPFSCDAEGNPSNDDSSHCMLGSSKAHYPYAWKSK